MQVKTKNLMVAGLGVALVLLLWYRVVYSSAQSTAAKAKSATETAEARSKLLRKELDGGAAKKKSKEQQVTSDALKLAIPAEDQMTDFVRKTDEISRASGVEWQSVTPSEPTIDGGLSTIEVGINVGGSYAQVTDYLNRMLALQRVFVIDNVSFTAGGSDSTTSGGGPTGDVFAGVGSAPTMQVQISGQLFTQPPAGTVVVPVTGAAPAAAPASSPAQSK